MNFGRFTADICFSAVEPVAVVYLIGVRDKDELLPLIHEPAVLVFIGGICWNDDLSPWPAQRVFRQESDFGGNSDELLRTILDEIMPAAEEMIGHNLPAIIAGYSLAGLFSLWAATRTECFTAAASMSGSVWYDGFMEYTITHPLQCHHLYLSVGDKEKRTRNQRMSSVEINTRLLYEQEMQKCNAVFRLQPGNHFQDVPMRIADGINWCIHAIGSV